MTRVPRLIRADPTNLNIALLSFHISFRNNVMSPLLLFYLQDYWCVNIISLWILFLAR